MGQYYRPVIETAEGIHVFNGKVGNEYTLAKLMEHSWYRNEMVAAVMYQILKAGGAKLAWVGDYADANEYIPSMTITPDDVWSQNGELLPREFLYPDGAIIANHTKQCYLDMDRYYDRVNNHEACRNFDWTIHPLPLLTALGNGRGGGDFRGGIGEEDIGSWCGDFISIEGIPPAGYKEEAVAFIET